MSKREIRINHKKDATQVIFPMGNGEAYVIYFQKVDGEDREYGIIGRF